MTSPVNHPNHDAAPVRNPVVYPNRRRDVWRHGVIVFTALTVIGGGYVWAHWPETQAIRVIDPDTVDIGLDGNIRITFADGAGADGPEKGGRADCPAEREAEEAGRTYAIEWLTSAKRVKLNQAKRGERDFFGRLLGDLTVDGVSYAETMQAAGYLRKWDYDGCGKSCKPDWCAADFAAP